mmetsp:Transcript_8716/g.12659  ORF Transcript_8716/g.12659 Transcript_8716/m.12659 type:complete len:438 (+) Transcript_8716:89-1402(+)
MVVRVSDTEQHGEGRSMYTTYKVVVENESKEGSVRRRYSDFQWLYGRLHTERPGAFVPIIQHQRAVQKSTRFSEELIEGRKVQLEQFLQRVTIHPELHDAPSLATFLFSSDELFEEAKKNSDQLDRFAGGAAAIEAAEDAASGKTTSWKERMKLKLQKTVTAISGTELEKTADEPEFSAMAEYVHDLDILVRALAKHASSLTKSTEDTANNLAEVGQIFEALSQAPSHQGHPVHTLLERLAQAAADVSSIWFERIDKEDIAFDAPMKDLTRAVQSAHRAIQSRNNVRLTYTTWQTKVKNRKNTLDKLRGRPGTPQEKTAKAVDDLKDAESSAAAAKTQLDEVSKRIRREIKRFRAHIETSIRSTMLEYTRIQIDSAKMLENEWDKLVPDIATDGQVEDLNQSFEPEMKVEAKQEESANDTEETTSSPPAAQASLQAV